jgi:hypothetical protein
LQEFLWDRNSCIYSGFLRNPEDSGGFRRIPVPPIVVWLRAATKEGSLLSKIWTKTDLFQPLSRTGLDNGVRCRRPLLAPPSLKVRAAAVAEAIMAEEAALMVEALADVALE